MSVLTPFGKVVRKFRLERGLKLLDLAGLMGTSAAFVSAVETGRKPIPDAYVLQVVRAMNLSTSEIKELRTAADRTRKEVRVDRLSAEQRELVAVFARGILDYEPDKIEKFKRLLLSLEGEVPFRRKRGVVVPPLSIKAIRAHAEKLRSIFVKEDEIAFPIMEVLEFRLPKILDGFYVDIRDRHSMGLLEGMVIAGRNSIALREDVYAGACNGEGRPRFTCCHELGHFFLHGEVAMARASESFDHIYCDSEWQADTFAGSLMMSPRHLAQLNNEETAAKRCRMTPLAAHVMWDKYCKEGLVVTR